MDLNTPGPGVEMTQLLKCVYQLIVIKSFVSADKGNFYENYANVKHFYKEERNFYLYKVIVANEQNSHLQMLYTYNRDTGEMAYIDAYIYKVQT